MTPPRTKTTGFPRRAGKPWGQEAPELFAVKELTIILTGKLNGAVATCAKRWKLRQDGRIRDCEASDKILPSLTTKYQSRIF